MHRTRTSVSSSSQFDSWGVLRSEGHDSVAIFSHVGSNEGKLILAFGFDADLVVASLPVEADEIQLAFRVAETVQSVIARWYQIVEGLRECVEGSIIDAKMPNEVVLSVISSWCGFGAKMIFKRNPPPQLRIQPLWSRSFIYSWMILPMLMQ